MHTLLCFFGAVIILFFKKFHTQQCLRENTVLCIETRITNSILITYIILLLVVLVCIHACAVVEGIPVTKIYMFGLCYACCIEYQYRFALCIVGCWLIYYILTSLHARINTSCWILLTLEVPSLHEYATQASVVMLGREGHIIVY